MESRFIKECKDIQLARGRIFSYGALLRTQKFIKNDKLSEKSPEISQNKKYIYGKFRSNFLDFIDFSLW